MKQSFSLLSALLTLVTLLTIPSCRKFCDYIHDHPNAHDSLCRITKLTFGNTAGALQIGVTYNAKGDPTDMLELNAGKPYRITENHFRYDGQGRLAVWLFNSSNPDPNVVPTAFAWHKYGYPQPDIINDTVITYPPSPINGPVPNAMPYASITVWKLDAQGRRIGVGEAVNLPNQPPPQFVELGYDSNGNIIRIPDARVFDNAIDICRTNKVWQQITGDYNRNNLTTILPTPTNSFGLPTSLPFVVIPTSASSPNGIVYIDYACNMSKGPVKY